MNFPIVLPLVGGALIGLAAALFWLFAGRVAGVSGIAGGLLTPRPGDVAWRVLFVLGLVAGGALVSWLVPGSVAMALDRSPVALVVAGALVGFGTRLGNGCTSGHGVCGTARLSPRSMAATGTFIAFGIATATLVRVLGATP